MCLRFRDLRPYSNSQGISCRVSCSALTPQRPATFFPTSKTVVHFTISVASVLLLQTSAQIRQASASASAPKFQLSRLYYVAHPVETFSEYLRFRDLRPYPNSQGCGADEKKQNVEEDEQIFCKGATSRQIRRTHFEGDGVWVLVVVDENEVMFCFLNVSFFGWIVFNGFFL